MIRPAAFTLWHLVLASMLLCEISYARSSSIDPSGIPFLVDTSSASVLADSGIRTPAAAFNGTTYLVAWRDSRNNQADIYSARVSPDGRIMDTSGTPVCVTAGPQQNPAVASDGKGFLVAWEDQRSGIRWNVYAARLDSAGRVLDTAGILLRSLNGDKHSPSVAYGAGSYLVAWDEYYGSRNIVAALVDTAGQVGDGIEVCAAPGVQCSPGVAFGDSIYLVVWSDARTSDRSRVYAARITQSGVLLDSGGFPLITPHDAQGLPSVTYDGNNFLVAWQEGPILNSDILAARVAPTGAVLDTIAIRVSDAAGDQFRPRVAFVDSCCFVIWQDSRNGTPDVYCARVTSAGHVVDTAGIRVADDAGPELDPVLAAGTGQLLAAWQNDRAGSLPHGISGSRMSTSGVVLDSTPLLVGKNVRNRYTRQENPSVTYGDSSWLVVWSDYRPDTLHTSVYATRVSRDGHPLDDEATRVSCRESHDNRSPRAAFDGSNYLVVWQDSASAVCDIRGRRLSASGELLDSADLPIAMARARAGSPAVLYDGSDFLVVWQELVTGNFAVFGSRVSPAGVLLDTSPIIINEGRNRNSMSPTVARGDSWSLVVWRDSLSGIQEYLEAARVSGDGRVLDSLPAVLRGGLRRCRYPAVARDGDQYLVISADRNANLYPLMGTLMRWPGQDPETTQVTLWTTTAQQASTAVAFNDRDYLVAWMESPHKMTIYGVRVNRTGGVMDLFQVLGGSRDYYLGGLALGPDSSLLVVLTTMADSINGRPANCSRVWGLLSPLSGIAERGGPPSVSRLECTPNPFTHSTVIRFFSSSARPSRLDIYDVSGRMVRSISASLSNHASPFATVWDGLDDHGSVTGPGCYFVRLVCGGTRTVTKLVRSR